MGWLNSLYGFLDLLGGSYQSILKDLTGSYEVIYSTIQWLLISQIIGLVFIKKMQQMKDLKKYYIGIAILFALLLLFGKKDSILILFLIDTCGTLCMRINTQNIISNTHKIMLITRMAQYNGMVRIALSLFGIATAIAIKLGATYNLLIIFAVLHIIMTTYVCFNWSIKFAENVEEKEATRVDKDIVIFIIANTFNMTATAFNLFYLNLTEANGYSISLITLLAAIGSLASGLLLVVFSKSEQNIEFYTKKLLTTKVLMGIMPALVILNFPLYPFLYIPLAAANTFLFSNFQTIFLGAKDKSGMAFLTGLSSCIGYGAYTLIVSAIKSGAITLPVLALYSFVGYTISGLLTLKLKEEGVEHDYTLTI